MGIRGRWRAVAAVGVTTTIASAALAISVNTAAAAAPVTIPCSIDGSAPTAAPVPAGSVVQLVYASPAGPVAVGPATTVGSAGTQVLAAPLTTTPLAPALCQATVVVQGVGAPSVPLPPVPALPQVPVPPALPLPTAATAPLPAVAVPPAPAPPAGRPVGGAAANPSGNGPAAAPGPAPAPASGSPAPAAGPVTYSGSVQGASLGQLLTPVGTGSVMRFDFGRVPLFDYASTALVAAGGAGRAPSPASVYGTELSGYAPVTAPLAAAGADPAVLASQVRALGPNPAPGLVSVATLLAVLMLSGTSAAVVRTWVLRRAGVTAA
jgi:hypothetical protein